MNKELHFAHEILRILHEQNSITKQQMATIEKLFESDTKRRLEEFLFEEDLVSKKEYLNALSTYFAVPAFDCAGVFFDTNLLHMFPKELLLESVCIPFEVDQNVLIMVANDPELPSILPDCGEYMSYDIRFMVGIANDIADAVKEYYDPSLTALVPDEIDYEEEKLEDDQNYFEETLEDNEKESEEAYEED